MQFLAGSLLELITQTSTNLPPDVRAAMSVAMEQEESGTQASQALGIIAGNIDMAQDDEAPICQDTGMPTSRLTRNTLYWRSSENDSSSGPTSGTSNVRIVSVGATGRGRSDGKASAGEV